MSSKKTGTVKTTKYEKSKNGTEHDASGNSPREHGKIMYGTGECAEKRTEIMPRAVLAGLLIFAALIATVIFVNYIRDRQITTVPPTPSKVDFNKNGLDDYTDFLNGARKDAENHPTYDGRYWEEAYPPDNIGVCSDVVWRAFREAGYCLRDMVDTDIRENPSTYPRAQVPDNRIDFRRVKNLKIFFDRHAISLTLDPTQSDEWQAGDIVIFGDMKHIGIISDKRTGNGRAYVIHNGGQEEREEDFLLKMPITGHYRFDASRVDSHLLIAWHED